MKRFMNIAAVVLVIAFLAAVGPVYREMSRRSDAEQSANRQKLSNEMALSIQESKVELLMAQIRSCQINPSGADCERIRRELKKAKGKQ